MTSREPKSCRFDVPDPSRLRDLAAAPLPLGLGSPAATRSFHRDIYFDTADDALRRRGVSVRFRLTADDRRVLSLEVADAGAQAGIAELTSGGCWRADVPELDAWRALAGNSEPARRVRGLVDPAHLEPRLQLETERLRRRLKKGWLRRPFLEAEYDVCTVRSSGLARSFQELRLTPLAPGAPAGDVLVRAVEDAYGLRPVSADTWERAQLLLKWMEAEAAATALRAPRAVVLVGEDAGRIACRVEAGALRLPSEEGSGEEACRSLLRRCFGSAAADVHLLGSVPPVEGRRMLEIWLAKPQLGPDTADGIGMEWLSLDEIMARVGSPAMRDSETLAALSIAARANLLTDRPRGTGVWSHRNGASDAASPGGHVPMLTPIPAPRLAAAALDVERPDPSHFLNSELSLLEFIARVQALAETPRVPLLERLRFLSIVAGNLDEFFMVRVGGLKRAAGEVAEERSADGLTAQEQLDAIGFRVRQLVVRQYRALDACLAELREAGVRVAEWRDLTEAQRAQLREYFREEVYATLTPLAMTLSAGHPFPRVPNLALSLAVVVRDPKPGPAHFAQLELAAELPRFVPVPGTRDVILLEELVRANLGALYPDSQIEACYTFRVTRAGDLAMREPKTGSLLDAVEEAAKRRPRNPAVRVEVDRAMPEVLRDLLLGELDRELHRELQRERERAQRKTGAVRAIEAAPSSGALLAASVDGAHGRADRLDRVDLYEVDGPLDLGGLRELASLDLPELKWPRFRGHDPLAGTSRSFFETLRDGEVLVHHPYDEFAGSVQRLLDEAADDPHVTTIKLTLYRAGERSPVVDALVRAAGAGKEVVAFVELKARFDEERNVGWAKRLEDAGVHVVHGLVGLKTHAKVALVVRREEGRRRRYVHIGTGNYNADTARLYADLGLFTADEDTGADLSDLFNELTGSAKAPRRAFRRCLVSPHGLIPGILERIAREAEHARAGRGGAVAIKVNGLSDMELVQALYRASQAGVRVDLFPAQWDPKLGIHVT